MRISGNTSTTDNWKIKLEFANQAWDQSTLTNKKFKGELYVDDVVCT